MLILSSGHVIILQMGIKNHNQIMYASWDMECERHTFLSFWAIFCPFTSPLTPKIKNWKKSKKNPWRYYPFTNVHHQWRSYDVRFLRYKAWQRDFFVILGHFSPLMFLTTQKSKLKKNEKKKCMEILSFYTCIAQMTIIWYIVPEIWSATDRILSHLGPFFGLLPHNNTEKQNLKIKKKKA